MLSTDELLAIAAAFGIPAAPETRMRPSHLGYDLAGALLEGEIAGPLDGPAIHNLLSYMDERRPEELARLLPLLLVSLALDRERSGPEARDDHEHRIEMLDHLRNPLRDRECRGRFAVALGDLCSIEQLDRLGIVVSELIGETARTLATTSGLRALVAIKEAITDTAFAKSLLPES